MLEQVMKSKRAACHSDRSVYARGLCHQCYTKWLRDTNPEYVKRQKENHRRWLETHREQKKQADKNWRLKQSPEYSHVKKLRSNYDMTPDDYDRLLQEQGGVCAICGKCPTKQKLHVDHDHNTGVVRGLLCFRCNFGLSYFSENHVILRKASEYLENCKCRVDLITQMQNDRHDLENRELLKLQNIQTSSRTKVMPSEIREVIQTLYAQDIKLKELCELYPQFSRSVLYRAATNKQH